MDVKENRETELDILRFVALFFVVALHVTSSVWGNITIMSSDWVQTTLWRATWPVPIFVLISGRFFLDPKRTITTKHIWKKYLRRLIIAFMFWTISYQIWYAIEDYIQGKNIVVLWKNYIYEGIKGTYHMWYIYMLAGLYILTPIIRKFVVDRKILEYTIFMAFMYRIVVYFGKELPYFGYIINEIMDKMQLQFLSGFLIYYLLGYYLYEYDLTERMEYAIYICGIVCMLGSRVADSYLAVKNGVVIEYFTNYASPITVIYAVAIYVLFVKRISKINFSVKIQYIFAQSTKYGFGVYLVHALVLGILMKFSVFKLSFMLPILWTPVVVVICLIISFSVVIVMKMIPGIGKYIV